jgi:cell division protein FtsB
MINKLTVLFLVCASIILFFFTIVGKKGVIHLNKVNNELQVLEDKDRELEKRINEVKNEIFAIKNSDHILEQKSREHLGLSKAGEIVYIIKKESDQIVSSNNVGSAPEPNLASIDEQEENFEKAN